ncbi:MAG: hypothetical protein WC712_09165 [Candidatus Brocadiia bacterium]
MVERLRVLAIVIALALLFFGQRGLSADFGAPWSRASSINHCFGRHNGSYWFAVSNQGFHEVRLWAFSDSDRRGPRVSRHTEYLTKTDIILWRPHADCLFGKGADGRIHAFQFDTAEDRIGPRVGTWLVLGPGEMVATKTDTGVAVIRFDGSQALTYDCNTNASEVLWLAPTVLGIVTRETKKLVAVDCLTGMDAEYPDMRFDGLVGDNVASFTCEYPAEGKPDAPPRTEKMFFVFDGLTLKPVPDPVPPGGTRARYLRVERPGDGRVLAYYDTVGNRVFDFWTAFRPGANPRGRGGYPPDIVIEGDEALRFDLSDSSLWFYSRKTGATLDGFPLAEILCCSDERVRGRLGMFFADGSFVSTNKIDDFVDSARVSVDLREPPSVMCVPHDGSPDQDMFYVWNGSGLFRIDLSGHLETSPFPFAPGALVVMSPSAPFLAVGTRKGRADLPSGRGEYSFAVYGNRDLFEPGPKPLAQFTADLSGESALCDAVHFLGDSGVVLVEGKKFTYRKSDLRVGDLPLGRLKAASSYGRILFYGVSVSAGNDRPEQLVYNLYDFVAGRDVGKRLWDPFEGLFSTRMLPGAVFFALDDRFVEFVTDPGAEDGGLIVQSECPWGTARFYWDDGLCCLNRIGRPIGKVAIPDKIARYIESRGAAKPGEVK